MIKVKNETEVGRETEIKVTTTNKFVFTYSTKTSSTDFAITDESKIEIPFRYQKLDLTIEGSTKNSDTKRSAKVSIGPAKQGDPDHNTQFKYFIEGSKTKGESGKTIKTGISNTTNEGDKTIKSDFYIKKDID